MLVQADRIQLFRVLVNLLRNAAEAGARQCADLGAARQPDAAVIEIADDGPGLPEAVRAELFRPFAGSTRRGGTGLGLAIARDLMVAHGGDDRAGRDRRVRHDFRLTLRLADPTAPATAVRTR